MMLFEDIKRDAKEYAIELENAFRDLRTTFSSSANFSKNMVHDVQGIREIFDRMDRDERIPEHVTNFYRKIYKAIISEDKQ